MGKGKSGLEAAVTNSDYLEKHGVTDVLNAILKEVIETQPSDPLSALYAALGKVLQQRKDAPKTEPAKGAEEDGTHDMVPVAPTAPPPSSGRRPGPSAGPKNDKSSAPKDGNTASDKDDTKKLRDECLEAHNKLRAKHGAPPLEWSDECEAMFVLISS